MNKSMRAIAYSLDLLLAGFYAWVGGWSIRLGGATPDDKPYKYPGTISSFMGAALVLPGEVLWTTYRGSLDLKRK
jgi:hypothetical protein